MKRILELDKRNKIIKKNTGLEDFFFNLTDLVKEKELQQYITNYTGGRSSGEENGDSEVETLTETQHWGNTVSLTTDPQTITYASLGFPSVINMAMPPIIVPWDDRSVLLVSYNDTSLTVKCGATGIKDLPVKIGVEIAGYAMAMPDTIYDAFIPHIDFLDDRAGYVYNYGDEGFYINLFSEGIKNPPVDFGIFVTGRDKADDSTRKLWYGTITVNTPPEYFYYKDINVGSYDTKVYDIGVLLEEDSHSYNWSEFVAVGGSLLPSMIDDARVAGLAPRQNCMGFISACSDSGFTLNASMASIDTPPIRFNMQVRGG